MFMAEWRFCEYYKFDVGQKNHMRFFLHPLLKLPCLFFATCEFLKVVIFLVFISSDTEKQSIVIILLSLHWKPMYVIFIKMFSLSSCCGFVVLQNGCLILFVMTELLWKQAEIKLVNYEQVLEKLLDQ